MEEIAKILLLLANNEKIHNQEINDTQLSSQYDFQKSNSTQTLSQFHSEQNGQSAQTLSQFCPEHNRQSAQTLSQLYFEPKLIFRWNMASASNVSLLNDLNEIMYCEHRLDVVISKGTCPTPLNPNRILFSMHFANDGRRISFNYRAQSHKRRNMTALTSRFIRIDAEGNLYYRLLINVSSRNYNKKLFFLRVIMCEDDIVENGEGAIPIASWKSRDFESIARRPSVPIELD